MQEQDKKQEVSQKEEENVSREMTAKEMEQVTGGGARPAFVGGGMTGKLGLYRGR